MTSYSETSLYKSSVYGASRPVHSVEMLKHSLLKRQNSRCVCRIPSAQAKLQPPAWSWILLENLTVFFFYFITKSAQFHRSQKFITVFTEDRHLSVLIVSQRQNLRLPIQFFIFKIYAITLLTSTHRSCTRFLSFRLRHKPPSLTT